MAGYQGGMGHTGGVSVYGSGFAVGPKLQESFVGIPGADGYQRFDGGTVGFSGWLLQAVSTRLSSIVYACAAPMMPNTGLGGVASGFPSDTRCAFSGNAVDFTSYHSISGGAGMGGWTSAGTSSQVIWLAIGR